MFKLLCEGFVFPSDLAANLDGIRGWIESAGLNNLASPLALDVDTATAWPDAHFDTVYSANCLHIMGAQSGVNTIAGAANCLVDAGRLCVYGPFNYAGEFTSPSNARFDAMLKASNPESGIRDFEWLDDLAEAAGLSLEADIEMPSNNRALVWKKRTL